MKIGDKITFRPTGWEGKTAFANGMICPTTVEGRVTYVHPRGRFVVAEATVDGQTIRETIMTEGGDARGKPSAPPDPVPGMPLSGQCRLRLPGDHGA